MGSARETPCSFLDFSHISETISRCRSIVSTSYTRPNMATTIIKMIFLKRRKADDHFAREGALFLFWVSNHGKNLTLDKDKCILSYPHMFVYTDFE